MTVQRIAKILLPIFYTDKKRRNAYLASGGMFVLTLFFLSPLDLYLNNSSDFIATFGMVILPLSLFCIAMAAVVFFILPVIFRGKALDVLTMLICGLSLTAYAQTLFMNNRVVPLISPEQNYNAFTAGNIINFIIWVIIFVLPLCVWKGLTDSEKFKNIKWELGIMCISAVVTGMQIAGVIAAVPRYAPMDVINYNPHHYYYSYDSAFQLSAEKNICVFVIDMLDTQWMNDTLEKHPELDEQLDGFTFYENNMSVFGYTNPTLVNFLTQKQHNLKNVNHADAWSEQVLTDILRENGYTVTLLPDIHSTTRVNYHILDGRIDNLNLYDTDAEIVVNYALVLRTVLDFSFGKSLPYLYKDIFMYNNYIADDFIGFNTLLVRWEIDGEKAPDAMSSSVSNATDITFYERLKEVGLSKDNEKYSFTLAHLNAAHDRSDFYYNKETDGFEYTGGSDKTVSIYSTFVILNEYFKQMKELGIYDNSTIILVADHGSTFTPRPLDIPVVSSLLIKPENTRGALQRDKTSELSHMNFQASIMDFADLPYDEFGYSYFDIVEKQIPQKRVLHDIDESVYIIAGFAGDFTSWTRVS